MQSRLSDAEYRKQLRLSNNSPIATADFVLVRNKESQREFMLSKRTEEPYRGKYFVPGGKIVGGECVEDALRRVMARELGITQGKLHFVGCIPVMNPPKMGIPWRSLWHFHLVEVGTYVEIKLNRENASVKWFTRIDPRWPAPVRRALTMAGFRL